MREKGRCYGADPSHVRKSGAPPFAYNCAAAACSMPPPASYKRKTYFGRATTQSATTITARLASWRRFVEDAVAQQDANATASALAKVLGLPLSHVSVKFS